MAALKFATKIVYLFFQIAFCTSISFKNNFFSDFLLFKYLCLKVIKRAKK